MGGQAHRRIGRYGHTASATADDAVLIDRDVGLGPDSQRPRGATELREPVLGDFHAAVQAIGHRLSLPVGSDSVHGCSQSPRDCYRANPTEIPALLLPRDATADDRQITASKTLAWDDHQQ